MIGDFYVPREFKNARVIGEGMSYAPCPLERGDPNFVMSRSQLKLFAPNPHRWLCGWQKDATESTEWGNLLDCLFLTPNQFDARFVVRPDTYQKKFGTKNPTFKATKWSKNSHTCQQWITDNAKGRQVITSHELAGAKEAVAALWKDKLIADVMSDAKTQVGVRCDYRDPSTGLVIPLQCLIDVVPSLECEDAEGRTGLGDLKSCRSAAQGPWPRDVNSFWYDAQAALNLDMYNAATRENRMLFLHILSENEFPYEPGRRTMGDEFIENGRVKYRSALRKYAQCLKTNEWPGYDKGWTVVTPEKWMLRDAGDDFEVTEKEEEAADTDDALDDEGDLTP